MKDTTGTYIYTDKNTGINVVIKYWITDNSSTHEPESPHKISFDFDLQEVKGKDGKGIVIEDGAIEEIIDDAFESLEYKSIQDLIESSDNYDDQYSVGWQYLNNKKLVWNN